ncbi:MAG: uroporphyrinogen-III C-methyltransferase [Thermodesulfobacteriota bacterium]
MATGKVYLIGAGPGDPGLITVKGVECIRNADVVVYDYLAADQLLAYARQDAEIIYVGKKGGDHTLPQEGINALIADKAAGGKTVARLKGGDPFIFGRGGEEAEYLVERGIAFEIVPGVTSAIAAPAYAGIPLTHRDFTSSVCLVTGHEKPDKEVSSINWPALASLGGTLVFFMGVKNLPHITGQLMANGLAAGTPVALVRWGTTPEQKTVTGTLADIVEKARQAGLQAPCIIVVGEVIRLRETIGWFENRPLFGKRIVVTRARAQASELVKLLTDLGAACLECPTIRIEAPEDFSALDAALDNLAAYDWLVFTSVNGVEFFFSRLFEKGLDVRALHQVQTAVIGPATRDRLLAFGLRSDIMPDSYRAESVVEAFRGRDMNGKKVLLPRAAEARFVLPRELAAMGAQVDEIPVYFTRQDTSAADELLAALKEKQVDMITFTSSSTVKNFRALLPADPAEAGRLLQGVTIASIGPITTETAQQEGFTVDVTAGEYTIDGLTEAIRDYFSR